MLQASQGGVVGSTDGETLRSEWHNTCYNIVASNLETRETLMFHVWEGGHDGFSDRQMRALEAFEKKLGAKVAVITEGSRSSPSIMRKRELEDKSIKVIDVVKLPTGSLRWHAEFSPLTQELKIDDEKNTLAYRATLFPSYQSIPADEAGLNDRQRLIKQLSQFVDPKTSELSSIAVDQLRGILESSCRHSGHFGSYLLYKFIERRAKLAGFADGEDYMSTDQNNFYAVDPLSPELLLRKLNLPSRDVLARFKKRGLDIEATPISPRQVVEMLEDYPQLTQLLIGRIKENTREDFQPQKSPQRAARPLSRSSRAPLRVISGGRQP